MKSIYFTTSIQPHLNAIVPKYLYNTNTQVIQLELL